MKNKRLPRWTPAAIFLIAGTTHSLGAGPFGAVIELSSLDGTNGFVINGNDELSHSGRFVTSAGDINGDGIDDVFTSGFFNYSIYDQQADECYVVFGGDGIGAIGAFELSALDGTNGFLIQGLSPGDNLGSSASSAGDVNGDGVDDLIIGASEAFGHSGKTYVIFGGAGIGAGGSFDLASLNGLNGFVINGIDAYDHIGGSVASAGDVNGDGVDDIIIGAATVDRAYYPSAGASYVIFGSAGVGADGLFDLSTLDGSDGFVLQGVNGGDRLGNAVATAGDINNDGVDDLIIGATGVEPSDTSGETGASYVVFGGVGIGSGGLFNLSGLDGSNGFIIHGIDEHDDCGKTVGSAGDVNGDGVDDLIIGAPPAQPDGVINAGESYVVFGGAGVGATGVMELSALNGTNGFVVEGIAVHDRSGHSVSSTGDINNDGVDDLVIGAFGADSLGINTSGASYVIYGSPGIGSSGLIDLATLDGLNGFVLHGINEEDRSGVSVSSAGDIDNDGLDDFIIGASGAQSNGQSETGASYVIFGRANCPPDLNADRVIDTADLGVMLANYNTEDSGADINADGVVDTADLGLLLADFNTDCP